MIAFAAPNVIVRRQPVENPHKERIPHGASTDALGLSPAFPFRAQDRAKGQAGGWRKLGPRLSSMDPTLVKAGLQPPPLAAAALTRIGSIDSSGRQDFDGQERASRGPPTHSKKREPRTFPLDKKVPIQGPATVLDRMWGRSFGGSGVCNLSRLRAHRTRRWVARRGDAE